WREDPAAVDRLITQSGTATSPSEATDASIHTTWEQVATEAELGPSIRTALEAELKKLHEFLGLRETAKHHLMRGYALIRRLLVELDRRHRLDGGIFYLTLEDLPQLAEGADFSKTLAQKKGHRQLALGLQLPQVIFSDDLDAIGRPVVVSGTHD